jgi:hypothetical protein
MNDALSDRKPLGVALVTRVIAVMDTTMLGKVERWHGKFADTLVVENTYDDTIESSLEFKSCDPNIVIFYTTLPAQHIESGKTLAYKVTCRRIDDNGGQNFLAEVSAKKCEVTIRLKSQNPGELIAEEKHIFNFIRGTSADCKVVELFFNVSLIPD